MSARARYARLARQWRTLSLFGLLFMRTARDLFARGDEASAADWVKFAERERAS